MKIVNREWKVVPSNKSSVRRLFITLDDGSVYSCNDKYTDWQQEEVSNPVLEQKLEAYRGFK